MSKLKDLIDDLLKRLGAGDKSASSELDDAQKELKRRHKLSEQHTFKSTEWKRRKSVKRMQKRNRMINLLNH